MSDDARSLTATFAWYQTFIRLGDNQTGPRNLKVLQIRLSRMVSNLDKC